MALTASQIAQQNQIKIVDSSKTGFSGLTSEDFMQVLITQLQNQDPANPMNGDELLNQISQLRTLQSSIELSDALKSLTLSQQLNSATTFIGKKVTATDEQDQSFSGTVDRVIVSNGQTFLGIGARQVELSRISSIAEN